MPQTIYPPTQIDLHYITRVEGHGNIVVNAHNGVIEQCDLEIIEAPRYFEAMLRGQPFDQAARLASRICGICAVAHATTSLKAVEQALGVEISPQTQILRKLNYMGEILDSHILHVYMLVAPDLLGVGSVFPLVKSAPEVVARALRMKQVAGEICGIISGRHTHPIAMVVGGFSHFPEQAELQALLERLRGLRPDFEGTVELFQSLRLPDFERETEYLALYKADEYPLIDGQIASTLGGYWAVNDYRQATNEFQVTHSTAKHARNQRKSYMVGALARYKLNHANLHVNAKSAADMLGLCPECINPYMNTAAQLVEIVHCYEMALQLMEDLLTRGVVWEKPAAPSTNSGEGIAACEAPRGTLYHHYVIKNGYITDANCIIPTSQNLGNIEADMRALVPTMLHQPQSDITQALEMLIRAYDPCISCATHMIDVNYITQV